MLPCLWFLSYVAALFSGRPCQSITEPSFRRNNNFAILATVLWQHSCPLLCYAWQDVHQIFENIPCQWYHQDKKNLKMIESHFKQCRKFTWYINSFRLWLPALWSRIDVPKITKIDETGQKHFLLGQPWRFCSFGPTSELLTLAVEQPLWVSLFSNQRSALIGLALTPHMRNGLANKNAGKLCKVRPSNKWLHYFCCNCSTFRTIWLTYHSNFVLNIKSPCQKPAWDEANTKVIDNEWVASSKYPYHHLVFNAQFSKVKTLLPLDA